MVFHPFRHLVFIPLRQTAQQGTGTVRTTKKATTYLAMLVYYIPFPALFQV